MVRPYSVKETIIIADSKNDLKLSWREVLGLLFEREEGLFPTC